MKIQNTKLKVSNERCSMEVEIPWDASIEDWVNVFKTVLIHQTFSEDTVKELFEQPWLEYYENKKEIDSQSTSAAFNTPPKWWKDQIIGKDSCRPMGKEVW